MLILGGQQINKNMPSQLQRKNILTNSKTNLQKIYENLLNDTILIVLYFLF